MFQPRREGLLLLLSDLLYYYLEYRMSYGTGCVTLF